MAASTALIVVIYSDGSRATSVHWPTNNPPKGGWFKPAMAFTAEGLDRRPLGGMVLIQPDGEVMQYTAAEAAELLGLPE